MTKGINFWAFPAPKEGGNHDPAVIMEYAKKLGYDLFEWTVEEEGIVSLESSSREIEAIRKKAEEIDIGLQTLATGLSWSYSPSSPDDTVRRKAAANTRKTLEIAADLGCETILCIPGVVSAPFLPDLRPVDYQQVHDSAVRSLEELLPEAERLEVQIGIENVWNRFLLDPVSMCRFIDHFSSNYIKSYFDVGNVMLYGHPEDWIRTLGPRIAAVHMKDFRRNVGTLDGFVDLLAGDVDFSSVMKAFTKIGYNGPYTVEYVPPTLGAAEKGIAGLRLIEQTYTE